MHLQCTGEVAHECGGQRTSPRSRFPPSTLCVPGSKLLLLALTEPVRWPQAWLILTLKHGAKKTGTGATKGDISSLCTLIRDENLTQTPPSRCHILPPSMQLVSVTVSCKKGRERKNLAFKFLISGRQMSKKGLGNGWCAGHHQDLRSMWSNQISQLQRLPLHCLLPRSSVSFEFLCALNPPEASMGQS